MNKNAKALEKLFENHHIVFWYDSKKELRQEYKKLEFADIVKRINPPCMWCGAHLPVILIFRDIDYKENQRGITFDTLLPLSARCR